MYLLHDTGNDWSTTYIATLPIQRCAQLECRK